MITKDMRMVEILELDDRYDKTLSKHGLNCQGCPGAINETLEEAAKAHGLDLKLLVESLNKKVRE